MKPAVEERLHVRADRLRREFRVSRRLAIRMAVETSERGRAAARNHTPPAVLVREIRADLARTQGGAR